MRAERQERPRGWEGRSACFITGVLDPAARTLEVFRREASGWLLAGAFAGDERVRAEPFEAIELELGAPWAPVRPR